MVDLGRQGENAATEVIFDYRAWRDEYGEGEPSLIHKRSTDADPYPVDVSYGENYVVWTVSTADTEVIGDGECELVYTVDGTVVKSRQWATKVKRSLFKVQDPQDPWRDWLEKTTVKIAELVRSARAQIDDLRGLFDQCLGEWGEEFQESQESRTQQFNEAQETRTSAFSASEETRKTTFEAAESQRRAQYDSNMGIWASAVQESVSTAHRAANDAMDAADHANDTADEVKQRADNGEFNGKDLALRFVPKSIADMNLIKDPVEGDMALISTGNQEDEDDGKLFIYNGLEWVYKADFSGKTGVGIASLVQTQISTADEGVNLWAATLTNGTRFTFQVKNGSKGSKGDTPQRGVDYWTESDINGILDYIHETVDQRVGKEYQVMDKSEYDALTEYEVNKLYMVRW